MPSTAANTVSIWLRRPCAQWGYWNKRSTLWQSLLYSVIQPQAPLVRKILFQSFSSFSYEANLLGVWGSGSFFKNSDEPDFSACENTSQDLAEQTRTHSLSWILKYSVFLLTALNHISSSKSGKTMMSPSLLFFLLSQTLTYTRFFIFFTPSLTSATKAHHLHTLSLSLVISCGSWCSLPWGPCPSPLHSHPRPLAPGLTLPQSSWGMLDTGLLQHHRVLSSVSLQTPAELRYSQSCLSPDLLFLPKFLLS